MRKKVVLDWFINRISLGDYKAYTIKEIYNALNKTKNKRCLEIIWYQVVELKEQGFLKIYIGYPIKYMLNIEYYKKLKIALESVNPRNSIIKQLRPKTGMKK